MPMPTFALLMALPVPSFKVTDQEEPSLYFITRFLAVNLEVALLTVILAVTTLDLYTSFSNVAFTL